MTKEQSEEIVSQAVRAISPDENRFLLITVPDTATMKSVADALNLYRQATNARFSGVVVPEGVSVQMLDDITMRGFGWIRAGGPATDTIQ